MVSYATTGGPGGGEVDGVRAGGQVSISRHAQLSSTDGAPSFAVDASSVKRDFQQ